MSLFLQTFLEKFLHNNFIFEDIWKNNDQIWGYQYITIFQQPRINETTIRGVSLRLISSTLSICYVEWQSAYQ